VAGEVPLALDRLLWRTRGRRWDYAFLLLPQDRPAGGWYRAYQSVVASMAASPADADTGKPTLSVLALPHESGGEILLAAASVADRRRDAAGRPVRHTFFYLLTGQQQERATVPTCWPVAVLGFLSEAYAAAYDLEASDDIEGTARAAVAKAACSAGPDRAVGVPAEPAVTLPVRRVTAGAEASAKHDGGGNSPDARTSVSFSDALPRRTAVATAAVLAAGGAALTLCAFGQDGSDPSGTATADRPPNADEPARGRPTGP